MAQSPEVIAKHGLSPEEYARILKILGREPNLIELGIFSALWSEHCSYKSSRLQLKKLPREAPFVLVKSGEENAGAVDIGDGWAIIFKIESHNHPSAVEPFQGAATGVGGIIRDIFTMGARPILCMNSLRFGPIEASQGSPRNDPQPNRRVFASVVGGIAHYGNCVGVPTVGGEVYFDESYNGKPLVNVLCAGVLRHSEIRRAKAAGVGNPVLYVGSATGRDGLEGAAFASRELATEWDADRPAVQIGDPFKEKLLLEACLEALRVDGLVVGIQDLGAAGLACAACEMASRGKTGIEIDLENVPTRERGLTPYEIMLSESQERMLLVAEKGRESEIDRIFSQWDLHAISIGRVIDDEMLVVKLGAETVAEIPVNALTDDAPVYRREAKPIQIPNSEIQNLPQPDLHAVLPALLASPTIASKNWVYHQYDHMVQGRTIVSPGSDAAVIRVNEAGKFIAFSTDGNPTYCALDPYEGGKIVVAEAVRNVVCSGARPLAVTDNLNFANPLKPEVFWQLSRCVDGLAEACSVFGTPVVSGNVSLYNESAAGAIDPTPVVGMLGVIDEPRHITTQWFKDEGDVIVLFGDVGEELGGSEYLKRIHGLKAGKPPRMDLAYAKRISDLTLQLIRKGWIKSAHDCSEGGLAVALAECCISNPDRMIGAILDLPVSAPILFGESQSRIIVSCAPQHAEKIGGTKLGRTGGKHLQFGSLSWDLAALHDAWWNAIARCMAGALPGDPELR